MLFKKKVTLRQMSEGMVYSATKVAMSFFLDIADMIPEKDENLKNQYDWEVHYFCHSMIHLTIEISTKQIPKRHELINNYLIVYRDYLEIPEESKNYICQQLQLRFEAYKIAWDIENINGLYKLLTNTLVMGKDDPNGFMNGYIQNSKSRDDSFKNYYNFSSVPSANMLVMVTETIKQLMIITTKALEKFKII